MSTSKEQEPVRSGWREIIGILVGAFGVMLFLGILSYNPEDISSLNFWSNAELRPASHNWAGPVGAHIAFFSFISFGAAGFVIPLGIIWIGVSSLIWSARRIFPRFCWSVLCLFSLAALVDMNEQFWMAFVQSYNVGTPGGLMGEVLAQRSVGLLIGHMGAAILFFVVFLISFVRMFEIQFVELIKFIWAKVQEFKIETDEEAPPMEEEEAPAPEEPFELEVEEPVKKEKRPKRTKPKMPSFPKPESKPAPESDSKPVARRQRAPRRPVAESAPRGGEHPADVVEPVEAAPKIDIKKMVEARAREDQKAKPVRVELPKTPEVEKEESFVANVSETSNTSYTLPPLTLLDRAVPQVAGMSADEVAATAEVLQNALEEFGVEAKVTGVQQGPVVTCYEICPAPGVRVERIKVLSDNLALKMHAESIRIQAPIPGKGVCGVEVPNTTRASVFFREMIESREFQQGKNGLPLVLGKDVSGTTMVYDLAKMPHLLIAGATGAGKSVCMNSILTGLLMKHSPDDMRLILVDPKTVEFHQYNDLPHLVVPVITDAKKVALGLKWAIDEMERRFKWFRMAGVRDLGGFNSRAIVKQEDLFEEGEGEASPKDVLPEKLPFIVIVIDELADLMAVAQAEIEAGIARLAAKSRAAGIHMILATQRPDVKVITGTIKANFPVRIAFKVSQKVDSRTILDRMGADALLGKGDMLVLPPGSDKLIRSQGAFTSDPEIDNVTNFWKEQRQPEFITEIKEQIDRPASELPELDVGGDEDILLQALEVIRQTKRASTSSLQRRLRIGYTRAARVMDLLEERGMIGPPDGAGPREILFDLEEQDPTDIGADDDGTN